MAPNSLIFSLFVATLLVMDHVGANDSERKAYIVYMGEALKSKTLAMEHHHSMLFEVTQDEKLARKNMIHSYVKSLNGFAANLTPDEAARLKDNENVVSVFPNGIRELHTTRSWDFIGMPLSVKRKPQRESDIIVGMLDTGIYIDAPSFDDKGFGPPPSKWKGVCQTGANFTGCNNKVIGARAYNIGAETNVSAVDQNGHGTHTASTVAGVPVHGASLYGLGQGTSRGGVPSARIAVYKICTSSGCSEMDILAAFDDAIADGVDILSISVGGDFGKPYYNDVIAIGSFHAMKKGILTSASAGNSGPQLRSVSNGAPWMLSVGASNMDRMFGTPVQISNIFNILGVSVNTFKINSKDRMLPLTSGSKAQKRGAKDNSMCTPSTLDKKKVKDKIVFCVDASQQGTIKEMGGAGAIFACPPQMLEFATPYVLPAACVSLELGLQIDEYIDSTKDPQGVILKSVQINATAPSVIFFSSRGPFPWGLSFLKPDLVAPGVEILAAYSKHAPLTDSSMEDRFSEFNIISGTSMACPHASAAAAYVKSFHPDWSISAIKSALMTTATRMKVEDENADFAYGAGQIDPLRALNPGLVYETSTMDYVQYLCSEGYTGSSLAIVFGEPVNCSSTHNFAGHDHLNYPSMVLMQKKINSSISDIFNRVVTNVGNGNSTYRALVKAPKGLKIKVKPEKLVFKQVKEKKSFTVELKGPPLKTSFTLLSASLEWTDSVHSVRSPILVYPISIFSHEGLD